MCSARQVGIVVWISCSAERGTDADVCPAHDPASCSLHTWFVALRVRVAQEWGCEPTQVLLCCVCFMLTFGPALIGEGDGDLAGRPPATRNGLQQTQKQTCRAKPSLLHDHPPPQAQISPCCTLRTYVMSLVPVVQASAS